MIVAPAGQVARPHCAATASSDWRSTRAKIGCGANIRAISSTDRARAPDSASDSNGKSAVTSPYLSGQPGRARGAGLLPEHHRDHALVVEDQVEAVRVMNLAGDPVRRLDHAEPARQVFLAHDIGGSGGGLALFGEFFAGAILATIRLDLGLL